MTEIVVPECQDQIPDCIHASFYACCLAHWRHGLECYDGRIGVVEDMWSVFRFGDHEQSSKEEEKKAGELHDQLMVWF